ncbi:polyprenyl synthetase family protein [Thermomonas sp. S9]|uniref:polyprenyl synthetase family protein n=1 Tax=Thermomonas sp. S9 TaxID=2885203 RepID=UPI00216B14FF|nr:polyprenyl synthetase family protein [Thermomonas sp. S9]MCR6495616.1 polyprenyl synthetase family protein [Thermomonas sp. S9]
MSAILAAHAVPDLKAIQALAAPDMAALDALIRRRLASDVVLINQIAEYIIGAGGKRLRPLLLLLAAGALGHRGADAHQLAAVVEFIHTSTLLHDDVVDESELRRGRRTANAVWGNAASVLVGDFLYSRSFQLMVELERMDVQKLLADTTNMIAEGEVLQLLHVRNPDTDEAAYLRVIERKTAILFAAATELGALLAGADAATRQALRAYGLALGYAFQIADDVLDYAADAATLGKNLGDDLAEGKMTLPLIHAMRQADAATCAQLRRIVEHGDRDGMPAVQAAIARAGSLDYSRARALEHARAAEGALAALPDNAYTEALRGLARYAVSRDH